MSRSFFRTYGFLSAMLLAIVLGCVLGALWPGATCLAPLGTIFINHSFVTTDAAISKELLQEALSADVQDLSLIHICQNKNGMFFSALSE